jgi:lysophospholipase L1-like esterase
MHRFHTVARITIGLTSALLIASCQASDNDVLGPRLTGENAIFQNYVAMGNSITAGYQSGGISDATQQQSYAALLARQMGTRYAYASLRNPGCPAPIINFNTQVRPTGAPPCALRDPARVTDILNNVAVPGASSFDPTDADGTPFSNTLTSFILGGKSQVQRALDARPTFVSIGIIGNDYLSFAVQDGRTAALAGITPVATFSANYDAMLAQLTAGAPGVKGIILGNVLPTAVPILFPASAMSNPVFKAGFDAQAGTTTTLDASCLAGGSGANSLINTFLAHQIRAGTFPPIVACVPGGELGALPAPLGDILVLHPAEQTLINNIVNGYNTYLSAKAGSVDFAYYDPNTTLNTLKTAGTLIRATPNYASATAPFGSGMSLDGVHPTLPVHRELANAMIPVINAKYGTTLALVP